MIDLHTNNGLDKLEERRNKQLLALAYNLSRNPENVVVPPRVLRGNDKIRLKLKRPIRDIYFMSPLYRGSQLWDRLDSEQHYAISKQSFLNKLTAKDLRPLV